MGTDALPTPSLDGVFDILVLPLDLPLLAVVLRIQPGHLGPGEEAVHVFDVREWLVVLRRYPRPRDGAAHKRGRDDDPLFWAERHDNAWVAVAQEISPEV